MAAKESGGRPPTLLSTHPSSQDRIANLERLAVGLMPLYEQSKANQAVGGAPAAPVAAKTAPADEQAELDKFLGR